MYFNARELRYQITILLMLPVSATGASTFITECSHILTATPVMTTTIDVLHIDDDPAFTELVATYLHRKESQISVTSATSATEALSKLDSNTFDCIVSDYDMPEMDGLALLRRFEARGLTFHIFYLPAKDPKRLQAMQSLRA